MTVDGTMLGESSLRQLQHRVILGGYCVGCGACAVLSPDSIRMEFTRDGFYQARVDRMDIPQKVGMDVMTVCPFSGGGANEDQLASELFSACEGHDGRIGYFTNCYAGRVRQKDKFLQSSSGGLGKWILGQLLKRKLVDAVVQVCDSAATKDGAPLFRYEVIESDDQLGRGSKSAYYPVELSGVLQHVLNHEGRYAITGVPCFIKAIRLLCRQNTILNERICFTVGLVCGHLKSSFYAEMLGWQLGVAPQNLGSIDFRAKLPGRKANEKGVVAKGRTSACGESQGKIVQEMFGTNYGQGFFKYKACDYCDDVVSETADVSVGDAWLPRYMNEGTSLIIARNHVIREILMDGVALDEIFLEEISANEAALSQDAGLRHRREGLSFRLQLKKLLGIQVPVKRVAPGSLSASVTYKLIIILRMIISRASIPAFRHAKRLRSWRVFRAAMAPLVFVYVKLYWLHHTNVHGAIVRRWGSLIARFRRKS